jgi:glycosyltransferase involved in cell wall biosynthesis
MKIVFGSSNHWTSPFQVGSHAWARLFAKNNWNVNYISDPITPWHWIGSANNDRLKERFNLWKARDKKTQDDKIKTWTPFSLLAPQNKPFFKSKWVLDHWHQFSYPSLEHHLQEVDFLDPEIIWLDSIRHYGWSKAIKSKFTVLRLADWTAGFPDMPLSILELEKEIIKDADLVVTSGSLLSQKIESWRDGKPLITIRNGVDVAFWREPSAPPPDYLEIPGPRVVYVGALDQWFDFDLVFHLAKSFSKISFVIIGQLKSSFDRDKLPSNIYFIGTKPRQLVRSYLQHADVGIIPFKRNELIECVCPLKLYEYMACGLPVISTNWSELSEMKSPALLADSKEDWVAHLENLKLGKSSNENKTDLTNSYSDELRDYSSKNDWSQRWAEWTEAYVKTKRQISAED